VQEFRQEKLQVTAECGALVGVVGKPVRHIDIESAERRIYPLGVDRFIGGDVCFAPRALPNHFEVASLVHHHGTDLNCLLKCPGIISA
jgi:hypothetical protein